MGNSASPFQTTYTLQVHFLFWPFLLYLPNPLPCTYFYLPPPSSLSFGSLLSPCLTKQNPSFLPSLPLQIIMLSVLTLKPRGRRPGPQALPGGGQRAGGGLLGKGLGFPAGSVALPLAQQEHHQILSPSLILLPTSSHTLTAAPRHLCLSFPC